jgi:hypothetical protein
VPKKTHPSFLMPTILLLLHTLILVVGFLHLGKQMGKLRRQVERMRKPATPKSESIKSTNPKAASAPQPAEAAPKRDHVGDVATISLKSASLELPIPPPRIDMEGSRFALSLHKAGSTLLNELVEDLSGAAHVPYVDLFGFLFEKGVPEAQVENLGGLFSRSGYSFGGFRHPTVQGGLLQMPPRSRAVLLVRDPRDILVSFYFSVAKSHSLPAAGQLRENIASEREKALNSDIDAWVIQKVPGFLSRFRAYKKWLDAHEPGAVRIYRYEDVIFEKRRWLASINEFYGWQVPESYIHTISDRHDIVPNAEDQGSQIRKVTPGDHRNKLKPETIEKLNDLFREDVAAFGYQF